MSNQDTQYLFQPGESVLLNTGLRHFLKVDAAFVVIAQLPPLGTELQYRIKSVQRALRARRSRTPDHGGASRSRSLTMDIKDELQDRYGAAATPDDANDWRT